MVEETPDKERMIPCGTYQMRKGGSQHGSDGINGTIVAPQSKIKAAGAGPGQRVRVLVEANGKSLAFERKIHSSGNTLTIPYEKRQELDLEPGDTIEFWIDDVTESIEMVSEERVRETPEEEAEKFFAVFEGSFTYHILEEADAEETACGIQLDGKDPKIGRDPGDVLPVCHDCKAHSSMPMTDEEIADWLGAKAGLEKIDGPREQLVALKDAIVERDRRIEELESKVSSYSGRIGNLKQRNQELKDQLDDAVDVGAAPDSSRKASEGC